MSNTLEKQPPRDVAASGDSTLRSPRVDIAESPEELVLFADMPAADRGTLDVKFENGTLSIQARMAKGLQPENATSVWSEYDLGHYHRTFGVSEIIDVAKIEASYADGVLTVHLPKVAAAQARKISVKVPK